MSNYAFNIAKGRMNEFAYRVKNGDPAASRLVLAALTTDATPETTAKDANTFALLITAGAVEATHTNYSKKIITAAMITPGEDDTGDKYWCDMDDQTWSAVGAGAAWVSLILGYSPVTSPTNADIIPIAHYDFSVTPDGSDITAQIATTGVFSAA
jgi:hypothetical protein